MTPAEFLAAADRTQLSAKSRMMAYQVLVEGVPSKRVSAAYGVTHGRVTQVVNRVLADAPPKRGPAHWKRVSVRVPPEDAATILRIEARALAALSS